MRVHVSYSAKARTLLVRFTDRPPVPLMDEGEVLGLPEIVFYFDPREAGRIVALSAYSPFEHRSDRWKAWLRDILGPIIDVAGEASGLRGDFDLDIDLFEAELSAQQVLWSTLHNQLRERLGREPLQPLATRRRVRALRDALRGHALALVPRSAVFARGEASDNALETRTEYVLDDLTAEAAGISPTCAIVRGDTDHLSITVSDLPASSGATLRVGGHKVHLGSLPEGPNLIALPRTWDAEGASVDLQFEDAEQ